MSQQETYEVKIPMVLNITYKADSELTFDEVDAIVRMYAWSSEESKLKIKAQHWSA